MREGLHKGKKLEVPVQRNPALLQAVQRARPKLVGLKGWIDRGLVEN